MTTSLSSRAPLHEFAYRMLRLIRGGRKAAYRLQDQLQAWAARCDKTTDRAVQDAIATGFVLAAGGGEWLQAGGISPTLLQL